MRWIVPLLLAMAPAQSALAQPTDRISYVLFENGDGSSMMSGSSDDFRLAKKYRSGHSPLLYVRDGGAAYVIRDPAILARAEAIMRPQQEMGERQGEIGREQGELGRKQAEIGEQQARLGAQMADSTPRQMAALSVQQNQLGRVQSELGSQQAALGHRQAALGREQQRLAELARPKFRELIDEAIRRGLAQRVD